MWSSLSSHLPAPRATPLFSHMCGRLSCQLSSRYQILDLKSLSMQNMPGNNTGQTKPKHKFNLKFLLFFSGQLLDEVAMRCVDPSQCQVCIHEGQRISHGNKVILNHDDPSHCKIW